MSDKMKDLALDQMYQTIGTLYMDMKTFVPQWSEADNDLRIEFMLCSLVDNPRFLDRVRRTYFPKIWNVKEMKTCLESRLSVSTNKVERTFLYHEIARCLIEEGSIEKAYKAASTGYKMFKDSDKAMWCFNNGFLTATVMLMEGNTEDARMAFTDAVINARKLDRNDCAFFMQRVIKIATEPNRLDFEGTDPKEKREKDIVNMMSTSELRGKAYAIMQRVVGAPTQAKLQLTPSSTLKPVSQGNSRRSLKVSTKAKRRTLFDVKNSRRNNTQQHWVPSNTELPNID